MADTNESVNESTSTEETAPEAPQADAETTAGTEGTPEAPKLSEEDKDSIIANLRKENAAKRVQLRDYEDKASKAVTPEQFAEIQSELAKAQRKNLLADVSSETGVPASLLHGDTEEELREAAQTLKDFMSASTPRATRTPSDPAGGLDPQNNEEPFDATAYAQSVRRPNF